MQNERWKGELLVLGQSSSGLECVVKRPEGYHFYTVTDLSLGHVRKDTVSITMGAGVSQVTTNVAISPALDGAVSDYLLTLAFNEGATWLNSNITLSGKLTTLSNLRIRTFRVNVQHTSIISGNTDATTSAEPDTGHNHTLTDGVATVLTATHGGSGLAAHTFNVDWTIIRA